MRYTKELHLQHVEAFWEGKLEFNWNDIGWAKTSEPPSIASNPEHYRIKQLRYPLQRFRALHRPRQDLASLWSFRVGHPAKPQQ